MTVKLIRMSSGEDLVSKLIEENEENIIIENAIVAVPTGNGNIGFVPWSPLLSKDQKELTVSKKFVVYIADLEEEVVVQYNKMFSKIITPTNKLIK